MEGRQAGKSTTGVRVAAGSGGQENVFENPALLNPGSENAGLENPASGNPEVFRSEMLENSAIHTESAFERKSNVASECGGARKSVIGLVWLVLLLVPLTLVRSYALPAVSAPVHPEYVVELNTADTAQLRALPNIGPALAKRIVEFRKENGPFASLQDLQRVPGIGAAKIHQLRELLRVSTEGGPSNDKLASKIR